MDVIRIEGGSRLSGEIPISGAKNSALTLMPCSILTDEPVTLQNLPRLADVDSLGHLLNQIGVSTAVEGTRRAQFGRVMTMKASKITETIAPYDIVRKMRASILVAGPLLARAGECTISLPGGCAIGNRPIDLHLSAFEALGAQVELNGGNAHVYQPDGGLPGGEYNFPIISVGATENALMAAVLAKGRSILYNAAQEPEIIDLCQLLTAMGAQIEGVGSNQLIIHGVERLHGATHRVMPDRIEAISYACAAVITKGDVDLVGAKGRDMEAPLKALEEAGAHINVHPHGVRVAMNGRLRPLTLKTAAYPGLATDVQAQFMAMLCLADGNSVITETIFENRYMHVPELNRMGAHIETQGNVAIVHGREKLAGAPVMATDLRASISLVIAGLAAQGQTKLQRVYHLDRGYERLEEKLAAVGAQIERISAE